MTLGTEDAVPLLSVVEATPGKLALPDAVIEGYVRTNCARGLPQVPVQPGHGARAVICAGGPSLGRSLRIIGELDRQGACILAVNKASNFLVDNGIVPDVVAMCAPEDDLFDGGQFAIDQRCTYFVASCCSPKVFDALKDCEVRIFHVYDVGPLADIARRHYPVPAYAVSGTTITLKCVDLFYRLGFRSIDGYGFDGSFEVEGGEVVHHAYEQLEDDNAPNPVVRVQIDDRIFVTREDYAREAIWLERTLQTYDMLWKAGKTEKLKIRLHGEGLIPHYWRAIRHNYA